ncbi:MAG TPA: hypothetical protein PLU53_12020, partial [Bacteroidia bacterium]|nr:hypothetical protein [Bacteroidia bacterium]
LLISVTLLRYSMEHDRLIWRQALISLMVFLLASSVWILPLSLKYGQMTISKAASFNLTREVAPLPGQVMHLPVLTEGLLAPPDSMSASAWEAPGDVLLLTPLRPFSNKDDRSVYFQLIKRNLLTIYYFDFRRQAGIFFLLFFTGFLFVRGFRALFENKLILLLLLTLLMIYGGYSLILVHTRYVWVCTWIMLLLSAWMAQNIFQSGTHRRILQVVFACLLIIAIKRPVKEVLFTKDIDTTFFELSKACIHPIETMSIVYREEKLLYSFGQKLKNEYHLNGNIASLQNDSPVRHYYSSSLFIASFLPVHYYGQLGLSNSFEVQCRELNEHRIHYLFVWGGESWKQGEAAGYRPIIRESALGLSVYKLDLKE